MSTRTNFIKLQPDYDHDGAGHIPYPYWINPETGNVERQDVWKGEPAKLLGFAAPDDHFDVALSWHEWIENPSRGTGLLPVFMKADGGIYTLDHPTRGPEHDND